MDIIENALGNIFATVIVFLLGFLVSVVFRFRLYIKRIKLMRFFGLSREQKTFTIYLSTVNVKRGGSLDFHGIARSFSGPAVPSSELSVVGPITSLFSDSFLDALPHSIKKWLSEKIHWTLGDVALMTKASPTNDIQQIELGAVIAVGSQYYNSVADFFVKSCDPNLKMVETPRGMTIKVIKGQRQNDEFSQRSGQDDDLAIVERYIEHSTNRMAFLAAGLGDVGTVGAVTYLVNNWQELYKSYETRPFAICLRFQNARYDPVSYTKPIELCRLET